MVKVAVVVLLVLALAGGGMVWAEDGDSTNSLVDGDPFYDSVISMLTAQYQLSIDPVEQAMILNSLADQITGAILAGADAAYLEELLSELENSEALIDEIMASLIGQEEGDPEGEAGEELDNDTGTDPENDPEGDPEEEADGDDPEGEIGDEDETEDEIDEIISGRERRGWRLREKVADESLPEHVRANARRALENQARAMEHAAWSRLGLEGPPPWANARANREAGHPQEDDENGGDESAAPGDAELSPGDNENETSGAASHGEKKGHGNGHGRANAPGQLKKR